jgi:hypothetical protein
MCAFATFTYLLPRGADVARGAALVVLSTGYVWLVMVERRALDPSRIAPLPTNPWSYVVLVLSAASLPILIAVPALARAFHVAALTPVEWLGLVALGSGAVAWRPFTDARANRARAV